LSKRLLKEIGFSYCLINFRVKLKTMAKTKPAAKKKAIKKAAVKKKAAPKLPFYAHLLTRQEASRVKATNKENDNMQTEKYPNDEADVVFTKEAGNAYSFPGAVTGKKADQVVTTLKFPSDNDEAVTMKYPSDGDEVVITAEHLKAGDIKTTRYPSDDYAVALDTLINYKPAKGIATGPTRPSKDVVYTMKYPSDGDETIITF
jgi:hypothetical protein